MRSILEEIHLTQAIYEALEFDPNIHPSVLSERQEAVRKKIKTLRALWHMADIERRMNIPLDLEGKSARAGRTQSRFGAFVGSKGFIASIKTATRSLSHVGTALLVLSLIGINVTGIDQALQSQQVHWDDLRVEANQAAVRASFDKLIKDNPPQDVAPDKEDNKQEQQDILNYLSRSFEKSLARSDVWRNAQRDQGVDPPLRRIFVKDQILSEVRSSTSELTAADGIPMTAYLLRPLVLRIRALSQVDHQETVLVEEETDQVEEEGEITLVHLAMAPGVRRTIDFTVLRQEGLGQV